MRISRREAFSFALARKLLAQYEATPLHMEMRVVSEKIAESLEGDISMEPDWLSEHVGVLPEDRVRIDAQLCAASPRGHQWCEIDRGAAVFEPKDGILQMGES